MARQCTKPKRPRNSTWFKEKVMLGEALESEMVLDEEHMAFLEDNEDTVTTIQQSQEIPTPAAFQTNDLDAFDFDCDETPSARVVLMVKFSLYDTSFSTQQDAMIMSMIKEMSNQVAKCNEVDKANKAVNESLTTELERYKEQIKLFEERLKFDLNDREKYIDGQLRKVIVDKNAKVADFENQIHSLKQQLNATVESHKTLLTTIDVLKMESKAKEDKYLDEIIKLEKKKKALDNVVYKMVPALYCGNTTVKQPDALSVIDTEETLELAEESRLKMHAKQDDPIAKEKKVNISPIDYVALNKLSEHFDKHFVPQKQLLAEHAFWLPISKPVFEIPPIQPEPVLKEIPHELPTISLVKDSFIKMRSHVNDFENVVTVRTKVTDLVHTAVNSLAKIIDYQSMEKSFLDEYSECVELKAELSKKNDMVEKAVYDELSKRCERMENRVIGSTSDCRSKPTCNAKKNRIVRPPSSNNKNKVEDHCRSNNSPRKPTSTKVVKKTPPSSNNSGKLKDIINIGSSRKSKSVESKISNNSKPNKNWESNVSTSPSSSRKSKKHTHKPKFDDSIQEKLYLLHIDLCGPMRIESINEKKYILAIMIQVRLNATVRNIHTDNGTEFVNQTLKAYYEDVRILHQTSAPLFLWVEAVAIACYTENCSLIRRRHNKTPYELIHDRKPDLTYFYVFGALCYSTNDAEDLGLVQNPPSTIPYVPPTKNDWDLLFQLMFDEYLNPPPSVVSLVPVVVAPRPADPTGSPSSTTIDQAAPSASTVRNYCKQT
ncbi:retrovirus-related pol polyprotein from transposon TNT 1-94 [Tanacetum coccineum]